ncbi:hypothetical protein J6590_032892 [Homalodisca vitripennis]|nr:hypothetical protein J6590_032892 [Homalodisca vitripennis]
MGDVRQRQIDGQVGQHHPPICKYGPDKTKDSEQAFIECEKQKNQRSQHRGDLWKGSPSVKPGVAHAIALEKLEGSRRLRTTTSASKNCRNRPVRKKERRKTHHGVG